MGNLLTTGTDTPPTGSRGDSSGASASSGSDGGNGNGATGSGSGSGTGTGTSGARHPPSWRSGGATASGPRRMSPGRIQYLKLKAQHRDALLLFRMGDFYECFDEDAHTLSRVLDVTLTARDVGGGEKSALAGIPFHALDNHLGRLIGAGLKVAIAEQTGDVPVSGGIVERAVVRVMTPGTVLDPSLLARARPNYLLSCIVRDATAGIAWLDASTGEFAATELPASDLVDEIARIQPAEVLADTESFEIIAAGDGETSADGQQTAPQSDATNAVQPNTESRTSVPSDADGPDSPVIRRLDGYVPDPDVATDELLRHFGVPSLEPFDLEGCELATCAAAAAIGYLAETQMGALPFISTLRRHRSERFLHVGAGAMRDLEVLEPSGADGPTLLTVLDRTRTAMGARLLRSWLLTPLTDLDELNLRQRAICKLKEDAVRGYGIIGALTEVPDLERLLARASQHRATARELKRLAHGLEQCPELIALTRADGDSQTAGDGSGGAGAAVSPLFDGIADHAEVRQLVAAAIVDEPSTRGSGEEDTIREGFDPELDRLRERANQGRIGIAEMEATAREETGIRNAKVGYNRVFGYYIEVSKTNLSLVPEHWERRQTLVNAERFVTPELKELEAQVVDADERIATLQADILTRVVAQVAEHAAQISRTAAAIARLDVCAALAEAARDGDWVAPMLDRGDTLTFEEARHPVIESVLGPGRFVPNTIDLASSGAQVQIITGPNMSGKSTYIRQAAILVLMSQIGSLVPATSARLGLVDRIFTRVGATDDLAGGRSTFMVEMTETAAMLNQATSRSLAILDEIGRGTSTYDGLAIARSVVEFIHGDGASGCKTLFATHYHEMAELGASLKRARNLRVEVAEDGDRVSFLYRIVPGGADKSYGVHVARLAGMPAAVVARALEILGELESGANGRGRGRGNARDAGAGAGNIQLGMFVPPADNAGAVAPATDPPETLRRAAEAEVESMTPMEAINLLNELRDIAREELASAGIRVADDDAYAARNPTTPTEPPTPSRAC